MFKQSNNCEILALSTASDNDSGKPDKHNLKIIMIAIHRWMLENSQNMIGNRQDGMKKEAHDAFVNLVLVGTQLSADHNQDTTLCSSRQEAVNKIVDKLRTLSIQILKGRLAAIMSNGTICKVCSTAKPGDSIYRLRNDQDSSQNSFMLRKAEAQMGNHLVDFDETILELMRSSMNHSMALRSWKVYHLAFVSTVSWPTSMVTYFPEWDYSEELGERRLRIVMLH